ncbi:ADAMTS-like protein 5 isoform X2 [Denticeps clupeoides]|uniref:ADAMTS-like protein 5 isoform X2 n=1 Tax=Denticeps clupeoides TaxID=299321 RepID=UPI0010A4C7AE|nr:ADAMTS-like protein 5 isoform X2 [Denticeps clupeoides]
MTTLFRRKLSLCRLFTIITLLFCPPSLSALKAVSSPLQASRRGSVGVPRVRTARQLHFSNDWAPWSRWSVCSRSCGGGASIRTRTCITRNPIGGPCVGDPRQYKICSSKDCPLGSEDFRELQCKAFDGRPLVVGSSYRWTTFHGGSNPCDLSCLAVDHNFYYNFGRVLDGTPCQAEPGGVCVNGRCLKPGCDLILGSQQQEDACMVCGGDNTTCLHHRSVYQSNRQGADGPLGYNEVAMIPAGATHIRVTDNSRNYLALQNGRSQFVINGNWKISVPGEYNVAGTKLLYRRSADTWESFEVPGPTKEDLHVMVLATDKTSGIEYEYWLPPDRYALYHGKRGPLRQPQTYAGYLHPAPSSTTTVTPATSRPVTSRPFWGQVGGWGLKPHKQRHERHRNQLPQAPRKGHCGKCRQARGRSERQRQYCEKDFVFRAKIIGKQHRGEETRYDVQVLHTYRNRFRLEHREFLWAPNACDCPLLEEGRQYVLMARRHVNHEHTLNRILLEEGSYAQPYKPREHDLLRPLQELCSNQGTQALTPHRG